MVQYSTPQQESTCLTPRSVTERSAGRLLASEVRKHARKMADMVHLVFFICTNLEMLISIILFETFGFPPPFLCQG